MDLAIVRFYAPLVRTVLSPETVSGLSRNKLTFHSDYTCALLRAYDEIDPDHPSRDALDAEWTRWRRFQERGLRGAGLYPDRTGDSSSLVQATPGDHWLWYGKLGTGRTSPCVNIFGQANVPVYRVLWPIALPDQPLTVGKRPVHNPNLCSHDVLSDHPCVNPRHLWSPQHAKHRPVMRRVGNRVYSGLPAEQGPWYVDDEGVRRCSRYHHRLSDRQQQVEWLPASTYCPGCHVVRLEAIRIAPDRKSQPMKDEASFMSELERLIDEQGGRSGSPGE